MVGQKMKRNKITKKGKVAPIENHKQLSGTKQEKDKVAKNTGRS